MPLDGVRPFSFVVVYPCNQQKNSDVFKWVGTPSHSKIQMGWNSKPQQNSNGLELQATAKFKWVGTPSQSKFEWVGTPSHSKIQMGWNSKPQQNSNGLELQARANSNGLELQAMEKFK
jgi:hypothetical protein